MKNKIKQIKENFLFFFIIGLLLIFSLFFITSLIFFIYKNPITILIFPIIFLLIKRNNIKNHFLMQKILKNNKIITTYKYNEILSSSLYFNHYDYTYDHPHTFFDVFTYNTDISIHSFYFTTSTPSLDINMLNLKLFEFLEKSKEHGTSLITDIFIIYDKDSLSVFSISKNNLNDYQKINNDLNNFLLNQNPATAILNHF